MKNLNFHKDFTLNGNTFISVEALLSYTRELSTGIFSFLLDWFNDDDFVNVRTSGSTGIPKNILLKKEYMVNSAKATGAFFDLPHKTKALLCLSPDFIAGKMMLVRALTLGWYLDSVVPDANPLKEIKQEYDFSAMVPLQVYNSLDKLHKIKKLIIGGGIVSKDLKSKLQSIRTEVFATYGMTETCTHIAVKKLNHVGNVISNEGEKSQDQFKVLPNIKISKDKRGCLVIHASKLSNERIVTNDLVEIISENEFKWLGRFDSIINSGGIKLIPEQIEEKLSFIINERFFVAGIPDKALGEKLIVVIESEIENAVISNKVRNLKSLNQYEIPKEIYFLPEFVETETKKIQRQKTLDLIFNKK